jgi:hypothetical protein
MSYIKFINKKGYYGIGNSNILHSAQYYGTGIGGAYA